MISIKPAICYKKSNFPYKTKPLKITSNKMLRFPDKNGYFALSAGDKNLKQINFLL